PRLARDRLSRSRLLGRGVYALRRGARTPRGEPGGRLHLHRAAGGAAGVAGGAGRAADARRARRRRRDSRGSLSRVTRRHSGGLDWRLKAFHASAPDNVAAFAWTSGFNCAKSPGGEDTCMGRPLSLGAPLALAVAVALSPGTAFAVTCSSSAAPIACG